MSARSLKILIGAGLMAGVLVACQAPGFMGMNGESAIPGLGLDSYTLARVPIRVMLPAEVMPGRRSSDRLDLPAEGAKVYLALDPATTVMTDSEGIAPLTIPVNGIQVIRAEVRTAAGTMLLEGMMGLPFSREREQSRGPNTVSLPSMRELNEPLTLSLASTLVAAHLQERYAVEQIRYLDPAQVLAVTREVSQALKTSSGGYRTASLPDLTDIEDVRRVAKDLVERHEKVRSAFQEVFTARIPDLTASPSATASAMPIATASAAVATASAPVHSAGHELFPLTSGTNTTYTLFDAEDQVIGTIVRMLTRVSEKSGGTLANGRLTLTQDGKTSQKRFLFKLQPHQLKLSMPYRPEMTYPLPFVDGAEWVPSAGLTAKVTRTAPSQHQAEAWTVTITGDLKGQPVTWTETYQPEVGLVAFTWGNDPESPTARMIPSAP
jgi:hypothetical protein